jgi:hypothetical protein
MYNEQLHLGKGFSSYLGLRIYMICLIDTFLYNTKNHLVSRETTLRRYVSNKSYLKLSVIESNIFSVWNSSLKSGIILLTNDTIIFIRLRVISNKLQERWNSYGVPLDRWMDSSYGNRNSSVYCYALIYIKNSLYTYNVYLCYVVLV